MKRKILAIMVLAVCFWGFVYPCFAEDRISILITGQSHASLYPCNCPRNPSGGVARRATVINDIRAKEGNVLVVESGGSFAGGNYDTKSQTTELDKQRTEFYMESLAKISYDAVLISSEEFNFGGDFLQEIMLRYSLSYLSANLKGEAPAYPPYTIKEESGVRIAVIGITDPQVKDKTQIQYLDAKESLSSLIQDIKYDNKKADLVVVLSYLDVNEATQLLGTVKGIDILVSSNNPFKQASIQDVNGAILVCPAWEARHLAKINLELSGLDLQEGGDIKLTLDKDAAKNTENRNSILVEAEDIDLNQSIDDDAEIAGIVPRCFKDSDCLKKGYTAKCENAATQESECVFSAIKTVKMTVITPVDCKTCNVDAAISKINGVLPNTEVNYLTEDNPQAKQIIEETGIKMLPVYLVDQAEAEEVASMISQIANKKGSYYVVDPAFTGVSYIINREKISNRLDVFFDMNTPDMVKILDVLQKLKDKNPSIDIRLNFLAIEDPEEGIISKNGKYEVEEFLRGACINKYYPDKLWRYLSCRFSSMDSSWWEDCVTQFDMDFGKIKGCAQAEEGKVSLRELIKLTQELEIVFGPTFLINNQEILSAQGAPSEEELVGLFEVDKTPPSSTKAN